MYEAKVCVKLMKIDGVFSGGGVKAIAFIGCLQSLSENRITLARVAGTSAGAIFAALIAAGYKTEEINEQLTTLNLKKFLDPPPLTRKLSLSKWFYLYFQMGMNRGDRFEKWLREQLLLKGVTTFADLQPGYLKVIATDITYGRLVVIPDDLKRFYGVEPDQFSIATAVRMSAGFPYFFVPKQLQTATVGKCLLIDGGLVSNFPLWVFENIKGPNKRPIIGIKLGEAADRLTQQTISNSFDLLQAMLSTMKHAHDSRYISTFDKQNIVFVPTSNISPLDLTINQTVKTELIQNGKTATNRFLKRWPQ